jgi:isoaspartyl peptidase/L-asparaginase-like protein (Ntn-hydrolase superfamily)
MAITLAIHGGAGTRRPEEINGDLLAATHAGLRSALLAGHAVLADGGSALDGVTAAVAALEDDELFNAGRGAVLTADGVPEMDAAVMDGTDRRAGAVAGILGPRNPVLAARLVMERSEHVLLVGEGAMRFLRDQGLAMEPADYFITERRRTVLRAELARRAAGGADSRDDAAKHGTVGAVACDRAGHVAAATSTGGMTAKLPGRVGDSPLIGAGTFADNASCAVSATGHGEFFIRWAAAYDVSARMRYLGQTVGQAAQNVIAGLAQVGGSGGRIAVDAAGNVALPFNSQGMYRGTIGPDGVPRTAIWREVLAD